MSKNLYPVLDEQNIKTAHKFAASIDGYLDDKDCPYSDSLKALLRNKPAEAGPQISGEQFEKAAETLDFSEASNEQVLEQINELYADLRAYGAKLDKTDTSGHNTYFRLSSSLLKEVVGIRKQLMEHIHISKFIETMMNAMEDLLDADARENFRQRVKQFQKGE